MANNKVKILATALHLFNTNGMVNVRLQHIGDDAIVSVGNIAYHYKNKEAILLALYETLTQKQNELLTEYRIVPLFDNINRLIHNTYKLQQEYIFFYKDTLEIMRAYPTVAQAHRNHISSQISQWKMIIDFNVARGALTKEPIENSFDLLAEQLWMTMDFWCTQQAVRNPSEGNESDFAHAVWNVLIPYFTEMGKREYKQMLQMPYDLFF